MRILPTLSLVALLSSIANCQDTPQPPKPERPPIHFEGLKSWHVDLGARSIFLNRVAPPVLPAVPVNPLQVDAQIPQAGAADTLAAEKKSEILFLSATVYDRRFTEIRWVSGERRWSAFSNIDFNLLTGVGSFETNDTACSLFLGLGNERTGAIESPNGAAPEDQTPVSERKSFPPLDQLSPTLAQYMVVEDGPGATPLATDLAALDALHAFYDANRQRLADIYAQREAARIEREQWLKDHPPVPKNRVINYWKMDAASIQAATEEKAK